MGMLENTQDWKVYRTAIRSHLLHFHGEVAFHRMSPLLRTVDELEAFHAELHREVYMCPPHKHKDEGVYDLGKIKLIYGEDFLNMLASSIKERMDG